MVDLLHDEVSQYRMTDKSADRVGMCSVFWDVVSVGKNLGLLFWRLLYLRTGEIWELLI